MGSGIKILHRGGIRDLSPGIWDITTGGIGISSVFHGIRDQAVLDNNKNHNALFRLLRGFLKLYCYFEILFHRVFHGISQVFGLMKGQYWSVTQSLITFPGQFDFQLQADKVDAQPDQVQDLSRTSPSGKEKVNDVFFLVNNRVCRCWTISFLQHHLKF